MKLVEINGSQYPVHYSLQAVFWFADFLGVTTEEVSEVINSGMTERKALALMYSGLVAGSEEQGKRLNISFSEFQELVAFDNEVSDTLGALFQKQFQVTVSKMQAKMDNKKKPSTTRSTSKKSTSP